MRIIGILIAGLLAHISAAQAEITIIQAGTVIAVPGERPLQSASIIVRGGEILAIEDGFVGTYSGAEEGEAINIIQLRDKTVLPGLIDGHVHLTLEWGLERTDMMTMSNERATLIGAKNAELTVKKGFTTVVDLMSSAYAGYALRDAVKDGYITGPRILAAGLGVSVTGGHADPSNGLPDAWWGDKNDKDVAQCNGADDCMYRVRQLAKRGSDIIKITATGGVMSLSGRGLDQHFTDDEMRAIVEAAHLLGLKVTAHAHGTEGIKAAIRAGIDSIQHSTLIDAEGAQMAAERGVYLVPTLMAPYGAELARDAGLLPPVVVGKINEIMAIKAESYPSLFANPDLVAFGTDAGVFEHGLNAQEFGRMVHDGGMTPVQALRSATIIGARALGMEGQIGTLEAGKAADIIAVDANPLDDITVLENVTFVMANGKVIDLD